MFDSVTHARQQRCQDGAQATRKKIAIKAAKRLRALGSNMHLAFQGPRQSLLLADHRSRFYSTSGTCLVAGHDAANLNAAEALHRFGGTV